MGQRSDSGTQSAWQRLESLPGAEVCQKAACSLTDDGAFLLSSFGHEIIVEPANRRISTYSNVLSPLLERFRYFYELSLLCYLASASDIPPAGRLIRPVELKAGPIFTAGSHALPLDALAHRYDGHETALLERGADLGGIPAGLGDVSLRLLPFPRIPAFVVLWMGCEEFPARADLLLDSSCERHLPPDIIWATAMLTLLVLM